MKGINYDMIVSTGSKAEKNRRTQLQYLGPSGKKLFYRCIGKFIIRSSQVQPTCYVAGVY